jgi:hypothetical protein
MGSKPQYFSINVSKVIFWAWFVFGIIIIAYFISQVVKFQTSIGFNYGLVPKFDMNAKTSVPGYYTSVLLLATSVLLVTIARLKNQENDKFVRHWLALGIIFLLLSIDGLVGFHNIISIPIRSLFGQEGIFYFGWVIPAIFFVVIFAMFYIKFLLSLASRYRLMFATAGVIYIGGALGMELIGGLYLYGHGHDNLAYSMIVMVEESLEIAGVIIFVQALLGFLTNQYPKLQLNFFPPDKIKNRSGE